MTLMTVSFGRNNCRRDNEMFTESFERIVDILEEPMNVATR